MRSGVGGHTMKGTRHAVGGAVCGCEYVAHLTGWYTATILGHAAAWPTRHWRDSGRGAARLSSGNRRR